MPGLLTNGVDPHPGPLTRAATFLSGPLVRALQAFRRPTKQPVHVHSAVPLGVVPKGKLIDASFSDFQKQLHGKKEVLVAFYDNDNVCHSLSTSLTERAHYGLK